MTSPRDERSRRCARDRALPNAPKKSDGTSEEGGGRRWRSGSGIDERRSELQALLQAQPVTWLVDKLGAGSWFSDATKLYNSGQSPSREGQVSPWAMALACEGLALLAGGASRRLGARSRAIGAFPFVTQPAAPQAAGEAGRILGEIWAPLWQRPMTHAETGILFSRGRAELHGRGALTPAAFATAILQRGVDAGVSEFRRFTLGRTTSANTFEPRFEARFALDSDMDGANAAKLSALERMTALIEQRGFPRDRKVGQRWRFEGLRGPIEAALLDVAASRTVRKQSSRCSTRSPQRWTVSIAIAASARGKVRWEPLPVESLFRFADEPPGSKHVSPCHSCPRSRPRSPLRPIDSALSGSTGGTSTSSDLPRAGCGGRELRVSSAPCCHEVLDEDAAADNVRRGRAPLPVTTGHIHRWLASELDESLLVAWLSRLALFDWRRIPPVVRSLINAETTPPRADGGLALVGLIQPLVDRWALIVRSLSPSDLLSDDTGARTPEAARALITLIRGGNLDAAIRLASSRYAMAGARLASFNLPWGVRDPERLVAALLFTVSDRDRVVLFERWLRPRRRQPGGEVHV